jgi:hypothetical protein
VNAKELAKIVLKAVGGPIGPFQAYDAVLSVVTQRRLPVDLATISAATDIVANSLGPDEEEVENGD